MFKNNFLHILYMEDIVDNIVDHEEDDNKLTKPKKQRSEKQIEAFRKVMDKRKENIQIKKEEKLIKASEILVKNAIKKDVKPSKKIIQQEESSDSEEEEIIIVKSKPKVKKQKKVKKIIIEDSSSEDDDTDIDSDNSKKYNKTSYSKSKRNNNMNNLTIQRTEERPKPIFNSANFFI